VPPSRFGECWAVVLDTCAEREERPDLRPGDHLLRTGCSVAVLRRTAPGASG
jgi:hypothetical protein